MRKILTATLALIATTAWAATITVTSPGSGDFLGRTNKVKFTITGSNAQVTVKVVATLDSNPSISVEVEKQFSPDVGGEIDGSIDLNFAESTPEGDYTLVVTATEAGGTYNTVPDIDVIVDVRSPKFLNFNPLSNAFVRGTVPIFVELEESNVKEWRVRINNADIPNNSGATNLVIVSWDTDSIIQDGAQTINVSVEDLASNTSTKDISVTLDRVNPSASILAPMDGASYRPNARIAVVVNVMDQFSGSVHFTGVDVLIKSMSGQTLGRVARRSVRNFGNNITWTGRIRRTSQLPSEFKIVVNIIDRAGNVAVTQEVTVSTSSRERRGRSKDRRERRRRSG